MQAILSFYFWQGELASLRISISEAGGPLVFGSLSINMYISKKKLTSFEAELAVELARIFTSITSHPNAEIRSKSPLASGYSIYRLCFSSMYRLIKV